MKGGPRRRGLERPALCVLPSASCPASPAAVGAPSPTLPGMAEGEGLAGQLALAGRHC